MTFSAAIGELPAHWKSARLKDLTSKIGSGATPKGGAATYLPNRVEHALIRSQCVHDRQFDLEALSFISPEQAKGLRSVEVRRGDLLLNITGDGVTFARCCLAPDAALPAVVNQHVAIIRPDRARLSPGFLLSFLTHPMAKPYIESFNAGGSRRAITKGHIENFEIPVPPIAEQEAIAGLLQSLDDKIELNRRMSATLEEVARALYRSWFVDFDPVHARALGQPPAHMDPTTAALFPDSFGPDGLPKGWRAGTLGEIASNVRRQVKPGDIEAETPYIGLEHMPRRSIALSEWGEAGQVGSAKSVMRRGQILFGKLRPYFHKVGIVPIDGICSTDILVIDAKDDRWREMVLNVVSSDDFVEHANATSSGTRMPRSNWKDMARFDIAIPHEAAVEAFSSIARPMTEKIVASIYEARNLAALRDTLLPRLMSGELRIREAEKQVEEIV